MGTNFYWNKPRKDNDNPENHIGKRSASGPYCWDCGITLEKPRENKHSKPEFYEKCPRCGLKPDDEGWENAVGRELGFAENLPARKTGVKSCSLFMWAQEKHKVMKKVNENLKKKIISDEYEELYSGKEFKKVLEECPVQEELIGQWFS